MMNSHKTFIKSLILLTSLVALVPGAFAQEKKPSFFNKWGSRAFSGAYYVAGMALPVMSLYAHYLGKSLYEEKVTYERIPGQEELVKCTQGPRKIEGEYAQNIRNVIRKAGIKNPESVQLVHSEITAADSSENYMMIGKEDELFHAILNPGVPYQHSFKEELSPEMQCLVGHETRHLVNNDSQKKFLADLTISPSLCLGIRFLTKNIWKNSFTFPSFLANNLSKFAFGAAIYTGSKGIRNLALTQCERAADIEAAYLLGSEATRAGAKFMEKFKKSQRTELNRLDKLYDIFEKYPFFYHVATAHPTEKERIEYLNKIADELEAIEKAKNIEEKLQ